MFTKSDKYDCKITPIQGYIPSLINNNILSKDFVCSLNLLKNRDTINKLNKEDFKNVG